MNLDELRAVQVEERQTDSLQPLSDSFYADVAAYLGELREERERAAAAADDPFTAENVRALTDEIQTAEEVVEAIYERRVGKVVKRGSLTAAGIPTDDGGLTAEEADLFDELVGDIQANRERVLDVLERESSAGDPAPTDQDVPPERPAGTMQTAPEPRKQEGESDEPEFEMGQAMVAGDTDDNDPPQPPMTGARRPGNDTEAADDGGSADRRAETGPEPERVPVRITRDVGEILGIDDRTYTLAADDVVTLPVANAEPLFERNAAERIE